MKILHTSDWHLGRQFHGQSLHDDHDVILSQVFQAMQEHEPDVLIIAGDIYDRPSPPASAVKQFNAFIQKVYADTQSAIVLIAGNHDSGDRIASNAALVDTNRVLIRGPLACDNAPLILRDEHGLVAFSALPFANEYAARECFGNIDISSPAEVVAAQIADAKSHVPRDARWVVTAHVFAANAQSCDSERHIVVGGIETVPISAFDGAHYVALGHLHRPQSIADGRVRYCGSPLAFGFDDGEGVKSMSLVDLDAEGNVAIQEIPFQSLRKVQTLAGAFADIIQDGARQPSDDFVKVILTDDGALIDPMGQIRVHYPNALALEYARDQRLSTDLATIEVQASLDDPSLVIANFLRFVREEDPCPEATDLVQVTLSEIQEREDAQ